MNSSKLKKALLLVFPALGVGALVFWYRNAGCPFASDSAYAALVLGRLAGIIAALGVMGQLLVMSRATWLEPLTGGALPIKWHHRAGLVIPMALLAHPPLVVWFNSVQSGTPFTEQYFSMLKWDDIPAAAGGEALIIAAVLLSLPFVRSRLSYELWQKTHLAVYAGLALSIGHQLELGGDLSGGNPGFALVWYALLAFTAANAAWFRLVHPRLGAKA